MILDKDGNEVASGFNVWTGTKTEYASATSIPGNSIVVLTDAEDTNGMIYYKDKDGNDTPLGLTMSQVTDKISDCICSNAYTQCRTDFVMPSSCCCSFTVKETGLAHVHFHKKVDGNTIMLLKNGTVIDQLPNFYDGDAYGSLNGFVHAGDTIAVCVDGHPECFCVAGFGVSPIDFAD